MKAKHFIIPKLRPGDDGNRRVKENALWAIRNLPDDKPWEVTIKRYVKPRSDKQHGYYRVLLGLVSEHTGYEQDELHDMFRTTAGMWKTINGVEVLKSTKELSVIEMGELIEVVLRTASQDMDLSLPPPTQVFDE